MNCPTCGAPGVMIRGDQWECGECGDLGRLTRREVPTLNLHLRVVFTLDLLDSWQDFRDALETMLDEPELPLLQMLPCVWAHEAARAIGLRTTPLPEEKASRLVNFWLETEAFSELPVTVDQILLGESCFDSEAVFTAEEYGRFWEAMRQRLLRDMEQDEVSGDPDDLFRVLGQLYSYFLTEEITEDAQRREEELTDAWGQWTAMWGVV